MAQKKVSQARTGNPSREDWQEDREIISNRIYVGNLAQEVSEQELGDFFRSYGVINHVGIISASNNLKGPNYGFVTFEQVEVVWRLLEEKEQIVMRGRRLQLGQARQRRGQHVRRTGLGWWGGREREGWRRPGSDQMWKEENAEDQEQQEPGNEEREGVNQGCEVDGVQQESVGVGSGPTESQQIAYCTQSYCVPNQEPFYQSQLNPGQQVVGVMPDGSWYYTVPTIVPQPPSQSAPISLELEQTAFPPPPFYPADFVPTGPPMYQYVPTPPGQMIYPVFCCGPTDQPQTQINQQDLSLQQEGGGVISYHQGNANYQQGYFLDTNYQQGYLLDTNYQQGVGVNANYQQGYLLDTNYQQGYLMDTNYQQGCLLDASNYQQGSVLDFSNQQGSVLDSSNQQLPSDLSTLADSGYEDLTCVIGDTTSGKVCNFGGRGKEEEKAAGEHESEEGGWEGQRYQIAVERSTANGMVERVHEDRARDMVGRNKRFPAFTRPPVPRKLHYPYQHNQRHVSVCPPGNQQFGQSRSVHGGWREGRGVWGSTSGERGRRKKVGRKMNNPSPCQKGVGGGDFDSMREIPQPDLLQGQMEKLEVK